MTDKLRACKRADLPSIVGAGGVGAGAGARWEAALKLQATALPAVGSAVHAVGTVASHRIDRRDGPLPRGWQELDLLCWLATAGVVGFLAHALWRGGR
jgi:hypothetical protein